MASESFTLDDVSLLRTLGAQYALVHLRQVNSRMAPGQASPPGVAVAESESSPGAVAMTVDESVQRGLQETRHAEEFAHKARQKTVKDYVEKWLTIGGVVPDLLDLARCEDVGFSGAIFGKALEKIQLHYWYVLQQLGDVKKADLEK